MVGERGAVGSIASSNSEEEGGVVSCGRVLLGIFLQQHETNTHIHSLAVSETRAMGSRWLSEDARQVSRRFITEGKGLGSLVLWRRRDAARSSCPAAPMPP